ncbi:hypothetical protein GCM10017783_23760 [Deinococcus piscis]|uniref:HNH nuclease domain-containing protein n=1 Tax=Deinococcus piscis TaxID=394230 RepID=A0ABQ3KAP3_9DEIO|nr:EVE domain-containing protein [Deinococcus piscis]GHG10590.1 hypothetical protein GCM10017783_23760 [Deinococcus piscis]
MSANNHWIFQANPEFYPLAEHLSRMKVGDTDTWMVSRYRHEMKVGDQVALWQSGEDAGIYAFGELVSEPYLTNEVAAWQRKAGKVNGPVYLVRYRLTKILHRPLLRMVLQQQKQLQQLSILKFPQATNFRVAPEEWEALQRLIQPRNPTWARDELLLALDLYFQNGRKYLEPEHPAVTELSEFLRNLPIHFGVKGENFRSPASVAMKIANFMALDPSKSPGLTAGGKGDRQVWEEFGKRPEELHILTELIRQSGAQLDAQETDAVDEGFPEGKVIERLHKSRERNKRLVNKKIAEAKKINQGRVICEACDFDFLATYGELGADFAECHHLVPLSQLGETQTALNELAVLCANCHRMIHRSRPMLTPQELRQRMEQVAVEGSQL